MYFSFKGGVPKIKDKYDTFVVKRNGPVVHVELSRPDDFNSTDLA